MNKEAYLCLSAMLRAREGKMLTADRAGRMLEAQNFEECAKLLGDCGYEDMTGMNAGEIDAALSAHREAVFTELENLVPDKALVELFRLKYDYHNAKTVLKAEAMGADPLRLMSFSGRVAPEKLKSAWDEERLPDLPKVLGEAMAEAGSTLARTANPQLADFELDRAYFAEMKAIADELDNPFLTGYVRLLIDAANCKSVVRTARMHKSADFLADVLVRGGTDVDRLSAADGETLAALFAYSSIAMGPAAPAFAGQNRSQNPQGTGREKGQGHHPPEPVFPGNQGDGEGVGHGQNRQAQHRRVGKPHPQKEHQPEGERRAEQGGHPPPEQDRDGIEGHRQGQKGQGGQNPRDVLRRHGILRHRGRADPGGNGGGSGGQEDEHGCHEAGHPGQIVPGLHDGEQPPGQTAVRCRAGFSRSRIPVGLIPVGSILLERVGLVFPHHRASLLLTMRLLYCMIIP